MKQKGLSPAQAKAFYDWWGAKQDSQGWYEDAAIRLLFENLSLQDRERVFELGCGTGRVAKILLEKHLPKTCQYVAVDLSRTMVELARQRLRHFQDRSEVILNDGKVPLSFPTDSFDLFLTTYVFDLMRPDDIERYLDEARRLLKPDGILANVSLTRGIGPISKTISKTWDFIQSIKPQLVGGCRPVVLREFINENEWEVTFCRTVCRFGVCSEVLIAKCI